MLNLIKESFNLTNKYIILATPLILFSLISSLYILFSAGGNVISLLIAFVLFTLMLGAFLSGWCYMLKLCVSEPEREDTNSLMNEFIGGVGEYFLPVMGALFCIFALSALTFAATYWIGIKFIGHLGIPAEAMNGIFESAQSLKTFLMSLSDEQLLRLNAWNLLLFAAMGAEYFLILFFFPALFFKSKNPFKALFLSIKDLFSRKFFGNLFLYAGLFVSYTLLSVLTTLAGINLISHFIFTLVNFYYMVFAAIVITNYYYTNFVKIGANLDEIIA